ncbi:MAG: NUDIX hydrolase [Alphaproteobacteria bacterium]|nr:NUDIX hydrolase [Alphaproteobacteria bacterium]
MPVRPSNAASLILFRRAKDGPEILMGRRRPKAAFIPDAFVFPGGRLDEADAKVMPGNVLTPHAREDLQRAGGCSAALAGALATAAIRETWEETGLHLASPGDPGPAAPETWCPWRERGIAPDHSRLSYLGRAITPTQSPIRFHARFFLAEAAGDEGNLGGSGELLDLAWFSIEAALRLPIIDVTEFMLASVRERIAGREEAGIPLFAYRGGRPRPRFL